MGVQKRIGISMAMTALLAASAFGVAGYAPGDCYAVEAFTSAAKNITTYGNDGERYTFTVPKGGSFYIRMMMTKCDAPDGGLEYTLEDDGYYTRESGRVDKGDGVVTTYRYAFKPGTKVTLSLSNQYSSLYSRSYEVSSLIEVVAQNPKRFEKEDNDSKGKATALPVKKSYSGIINNNDVDYWKFKAPKNGTYRVRFVNTGGKNLRGRVLRGYKTIGDSLTSSAGDGWKTLISVKLKKGQSIYIAVSKAMFESDLGSGSYKVLVR